MTAAEQAIRWSTASTVAGIAAIAAMASWCPDMDSGIALPEADSLCEQAVPVFAGELAAAGPLVRMIRARLRVGQPHAQRIRGHLAAIYGSHPARWVGK